MLPRAKDFLLYRDVFGGWRWEWRDRQGDMCDSRQSYDTQEEAMTAARALGQADDPSMMKITPVTDADVATASMLCAHPDGEVPRFLGEALRRVEVASAVSGYEALKSINRGAFDAYVLDYWLPDWSGVNLCREIRKVDPNVPICIYTRAQSQDTRRRALRAGADLFLTMPQEPASFRERIERLLVSREERAERARAAAEEAVQAELDRQASFIRNIDAGRKASASRLLEAKIRATGLKAFLHGGGTRASFERIWRAVYKQAALTLDSETAQAA